MSTKTPDDSDLKVTTAAASRVAELMLEEGDLSLKLRVYVQGGGCSGLQYGFAFAETQEEDDFAYPAKGFADQQTIPISVLVDAVSMDYLRGAEIDYVRELGDERFIIRNP
ncbi:MAG: iron-sulfur cluster assembly accessory protein, partial [Gammaproteobacteria bacterium]|nr:iron-sulfur cluster assembly accessory protein [Gammaproteobacteria bacterium]